MERDEANSLVNIFVKFSIVVFVGLVFAFFALITSPLLAIGLALFLLLVLLLTKYNGVFLANILLLLSILLLFSGDDFILRLANEINVYYLFSIFKLLIIEWWVIGLFFVFIIYHLYLASNQSLSFSYGPLKPLLLFFTGGLILGIIRTITSTGDFQWGQIRHYFIGILLYLILLNVDFKQIKLKCILYYIVAIVSFKALYHLILYILGHGLHFGIVGYIVMGYSDILHNIVLINLLLFSAITFIKKIKRWEYLSSWILLLLNSGVIFLSLRRTAIGLYAIGLFTILLYSGIRIKIKSIILAVMSLICITGILYMSGNSIFLGKITNRIDSINVFKYQDDTGKNITSSTGHISEIINGWENVRDNIFLGKGFGSEIEKTQGWEGESMMVHNELLFYWIRMGIFGMLMFFAMYLIPIRYCFKQIRNISLAKYRWFFLAIMGYIIGTFISALTVSPPISPFITKSYLYFILLGFLMNKTIFALKDK